MEATAVLESCLYVDDLTAALAFYQDVLGLQLFARVEGRHAFFRCGSSMVLLFIADETEKPGSPVPLHGARGPGHLAFRMSEAESEAWRDWLGDHHVAIEDEVRWPGGGLSLYFRDPAGNSLELATSRTWGLD